MTSPDGRIRLATSWDSPALVDICIATGDAGRDATGTHPDDRILADVFVLPYAARHPGCSFVLETADQVAGYIVATPDTLVFEDWFTREWWPARADGYDSSDPTARYAATRSTRPPLVDVSTYPAHLHIDLLPHVQGHGWGRRLLEAELTALAAQGAVGVHLVADARNRGAAAFYRACGFDAAPGPDDVRIFTRTLAG